MSNMNYEQKALDKFYSSLEVKDNVRENVALVSIVVLFTLAMLG